MVLMGFITLRADYFDLFFTHLEQDQTRKLIALNQSAAFLTRALSL